MATRGLRQIEAEIQAIMHEQMDARVISRDRRQLRELSGCKGVSFDPDALEDLDVLQDGELADDEHETRTMIFDNGLAVVDLQADGGR